MAMRPSEKEAEFIARQEYMRLKKLAEEKQHKMKSDELTRLKELHHMHCPKCGLGLVEIDYKGVKIDKCSGCEGIWLDAGELDQVAGMEKGALDKLFGVFKK